MLIAYGIKLSIDHECGGTVTFEAKVPELAEHYVRDYGACPLPSFGGAPRYELSGEAAMNIFVTYLMSAKEYFQRDAEREIFYRTFYQICRRFNVTWSTATPEVRAFIEEVTRVTYEQEKAKRNGVSLSTVKPFFGDTAC